MQDLDLGLWDGVRSMEHGVAAPVTGYVVDGQEHCLT
jgi:hypothetical protein